MNDKFLNFANILLGTLLGFLIALPVFSSNFIYIILSALIGALIGFRRKNSRIFLYFCLIGILLLATNIAKNLQQV